MCYVTLQVRSPYLKSPPAKFGVYRPCESGDTTLFVCHATTVLVEVSRDFVGGIPSS